MLQALLLMLVLIAVAAWMVAVAAALRIVRLAPVGRRLDVLFKLGWWRFDKVRELTGEAALPHTRRYLGAFLVFFAAIAAVAIAAILAAGGNSAGGQTSERVPLLYTNLISSSLET